LAGRVIRAAEPYYIVAIASLLLFPALRPSWTAIALSGLALLWLARAVTARELWPATPFNDALLLLCLSMPLAIWASAVPELTLPKLTGLILGLAVFRVLAFGINDRRSFGIGLAAFVLVGAGIWMVGLLGMRLAFLQPVVQRLPAALVSLPGAPDQGINPNQLAGALTLYLPVVLVLALGCARERRPVPAAILTAAGLAGVATLILTNSRAGWFGFGASLIALAVLWALIGSGRPVRVIVLGLASAALVGGLIAGVLLLPPTPAGGASDAVPGLQMGEVAQQLSLESRVEIWSRALYALQDFPFTGVGLGTFRRVVNLLYPLFLTPPEVDIAHTHNVFLQAGVDLGLGGLVAYLALVIIAGVTGWQVARQTGGFLRLVAVGLVAALIGYHVYGMADALALGSKPSVILWMILGLIASLANRHDNREWVS